jgi:hypothetical protein
MWPFTRKKKRDPAHRSLASLNTSNNLDSHYGFNPLKLDSTLDTRTGADSQGTARMLRDHHGEFGGAGSTGDFGSGSSNSYSSDSGTGSSCDSGSSFGGASSCSGGSSGSD